MVDDRLRVIPVVENEKSMKLLGLVWRTSLLGLSSARSNVIAAQMAEEPPVAFSPDFDSRNAAEIMLNSDTWYAPVMDSTNRYLGMVGLEVFIEYLLLHANKVLAVPVEAYMSRDLVTVEPDTPIYRVWQLMLSRKLAALPVVERGRLVGVVAEYDLLSHGFTRPLLEDDSGPRRGPRVRDVMSTPPVTVKPGSELAEAARLMLDRDIGRIYVVDEEARLLGVVDRSDVVKVWIGE